MWTACPEVLAGRSDIAGKGAAGFVEQDRSLSDLGGLDNEKAPAVTPVAMVTNVTITMMQPK